MELWDLYDRDRNLTGLSQIRGEPIPEGRYHLVAHVWIRDGSGEYLISQRSPDREKDPLKWECVGDAPSWGKIAFPPPCGRCKRKWVSPSIQIKGRSLGRCWGSIFKASSMYGCSNTMAK